RSRNYGTARSGQREDQANPGTDPTAQGVPGTNGIPSLRDSAVARNGGLPTPPPPRQRTATPMGGSPASTPNLAQSGVAAAPAAAPSRSPPGASLPPLPPPPPRQRVPSVSNPPPLPGAARTSMQPQASMRPRQLYIIFNGQKIPVTKQEFVIGRG